MLTTRPSRPQTEQIITESSQKKSLPPPNALTQVVVFYSEQHNLNKPYKTHATLISICFY